jgi:subtilisin family serine protease
MALLRDFKEKEVPPTLLVEFADTSVAPASTWFRGEANPLKKLREICGVDSRPMFQRDSPLRGAVPASRNAVIESKLTAFHEVSIAADKVAGVRKQIHDELKDQVRSVTPVPTAIPALGPLAAEPDDEQAAVPDMSSLQWHLEDAPIGMGFKFAWRAGALGQGATIVDVEGGWNVSHPCLTQARFSVWSGEASKTAAWLEHGTAVVGLIATPLKGPGIVGAAPGARIGMISVFKQGIQRLAEQIIAALEFLQAGDVLLVELQRPGPLTDFQPNDEQKGYIPVSYWPDVFVAIATAVEAGVCVVEVGGNGGEDLDNRERYGDRFDQSKNDCGSILVGAGAPWGDRFGPARSRLTFSNYGARFDCQAGGETIVTAGYGDLWGAGDKNRAYTGRFMGTSSAAPLVAAAVGCLQGAHKAARGYPIPPLDVRSAIANIGSPQQAASNSPTSQRIGPQPDLRALMSAFDL